MASLLKNISEAVFGNAGNEDQIPPKEIVMEDTCSSCSDPCEDHKQYPSSLSINMDRKLLGSVKLYGRHIIISTGVADWSRDIERESGTLAGNLSAVIRAKSTTEWRSLITNSSMVEQFSTVPKTHDVLIFPDNIIIANVAATDAQALFDHFINKPLPTEPVEDVSKLDHKNMKVHKNPHRTMVLICSHKKRDKRCGVTAPILNKEFDKILRDKDLNEDDAAVFFVSHIGGHKFAGNVICYINEGRTGIWYGRVKTCHCAAIVEETLLKGKVIKELYRGAISHSFDSIKGKRIPW